MIGLSDLSLKVSVMLPTYAIIAKRPVIDNALLFALPANHRNISKNTAKKIKKCNSLLFFESECQNTSPHPTPTPPILNIAAAIRTKQHIPDNTSNGILKYFMSGSF